MEAGCRLGPGRRQRRRAHAIRVAAIVPRPARRHGLDRFPTRTGRTDIPLNAVGEDRARQFGERLRRFSFVTVFTSPLQLASRTCELAGFGAVAKVDPDLVEWDYGGYEGLVLREIQREQPTWELFRDGCPEGESPKDVAARADRIIARVMGIDGDVLHFRVATSSE